MLRLLSSKHKEAKIFENHLNPVILVFIGNLSLSTLRWVPICQGFSHISGFFASLCIGQISPSSIKVKMLWTMCIYSMYKWVKIARHFGWNLACWSKENIWWRNVGQNIRNRLSSWSSLFPQILLKWYTVHCLNSPC